MKTFNSLRSNLEEKTLTPAEMKKREEVAKAIERENPKMPMGMKMAIATKTAKRVAEEENLNEISQQTVSSYKAKAGEYIKKYKYSNNPPSVTSKLNKRTAGSMRADVRLNKEEEELDEVSKKTLTSYAGKAADSYGHNEFMGRISKNPAEKEKAKQTATKRFVGLSRAERRMSEEVDDEGKMAKGQLMRMVNQASALAQMMEDDKQLDGWVQSKLTMASDYLDSVHDYLMHNKQDVDEKDDELEESAWGRDKAANLKDALNRHTEKAVAANKAGDHEAVKVHQSKMNMIKNQMAKLTKEEVEQVDEVVNLDEVSKKTAVSYIQKKVSQIAKRPGEAMTYTTKMTGKDYENLKRAYKRAGVKEEVKDEYARKVNKYLKKKYNKEEFELDEASQFPSKEHAISYAKEKVKSHKDSDDGIEVYSMPGGGARVVHTMNSQGRQQVLKGGGKKVTTVTREEVELEEAVKQAHKVMVTVSEPDHPMVSKRKETVMKRVIVSATDKGDAKAKAESFYKKKGYKVHDSEYHSVQPASTLKTEETIDETKGAPKGFHFTKDGKLKRGDADQDGSGGPMLRSDPLDKQRSKVPPVSEAQEDQHYCAKHVYSNVYGEGVVLEGQHADPDETGNIEWYVVNFAEGPKKVYTEKLDIMIAEYHGNHKKKRMTNG